MYTYNCYSYGDDEARITFFVEGGRFAQPGKGTPLEDDTPGGADGKNDAAIAVLGGGRGIDSHQRPEYTTIF